MSLVDKAKDKFQQGMGDAKEKLGRATDNEDLRDSGKADQTEGEVNEAGHDLRDKAKGAIQDLKPDGNQ